MTKRNMTIYSMLGVVSVAAAMLPEAALAADGTGVGSELFTDVQDLIRGNLGVVVGLGLSLFGLWMWLVQQATWGLLLVVGGAALTAFPGIYGAISSNVKTAFSDSFGNPSQGNATSVSGS